MKRIPHTAGAGQAPAPKGSYKRPTPDGVQESRRLYFLYQSELAARKAAEEALRIAQERAATLEAENQTLGGEVSNLQEQAAEHRRREAELRNIFASGLTAGEKLSLIELLHHCRKPDIPTDEAGRKKIVLETLARHLGTTDETVGRHVKKFAALGLVEKQTIKHVAPDGMPVSTVYVQPDFDKIRTIRTLTRPEAGNTWGGLRCPACNSAHVRITRTITCLGK